MKERFYRFIPVTLIMINSGLWLFVFLFYNTNAFNEVLFFCWVVQTLLVLYCGITIKKLYWLTNKDSLTNIYNRRYLFSKMSSFPEKQYPVSLMMIDIDNFKKINDTYGHLAGDEFLRQFTELLVHNTRSTDIVARLGGEEFAVVLPKTCRKDVYLIAEKIKEIIETNKFRFGPTTYNMTISIGISTSYYPINAEQLLKCADQALYKAKEIKNSVVTYEQIC